jgi:hypothetical protein
MHWSEQNHLLSRGIPSFLKKLLLHLGRLPHYTMLAILYNPAQWSVQKVCSDRRTPALTTLKHCQQVSVGFNL